MAQRLVKEGTCDWCAQIDPGQQVPAQQTRISPTGKEIDVCDPCGYLADLGFPRLELMLRYFAPEVIERLLRVGRAPEDEKDKRSRGPAQLSIPTPTPTPTPAPKPEAEKKPTSKPAGGSSGKKAVANRGRWVDGVDQMRCPEDHPGANSPAEYWVKVENRGSHAASSHNKLAQEIPWEEHPDHPVDLPHKCVEHKVCAAYDNGAGFGFPSKQALATHVFKSNEAGWEKADKDAAETSAPAA